MEMKMCMTQRPYRAIIKAVVLLEEARAQKLLKVAHIKIGWVSCRARRKMETNLCYRCLDAGYMAADGRGSDRSRCCKKCGEAGYTAGACKRQNAVLPLLCQGR